MRRPPLLLPAFVPCLTAFLFTCSTPQNPFLPISHVGYSSNPATWVAGKAITADTLTFVGEKPAHFSISPSLPDSLVFDNLTGMISGTPGDTFTLRHFTVTVSNNHNSDSTILTATVLPPPPDSLWYSINPATYPVGAPIAENRPAWRGWAPTSFSVSPQLPAGIRIDGTTGIVYGTPTTVTPTAAYVITGTNPGGAVRVTLIITIGPAVATNHAPQFVSGTQNRTVTEGGLVVLKPTAHDQDSGQHCTLTFVNGDSLRALFSGNPAAILWTPSGDTAIITFAPGTRKGTYPFTVRVSDGIDSSAVTIFVTVGNANQPPLWNHKTLNDTIDEGRPFALFLADSCKDPEGKPLAFSLATAPPAGDSIGADKVYRYTPTFADAGLYDIRIAAIDDSGATDTLTLHLIVRNIDHPATFSQPLKDTAITINDTIDLRVTATDPEGIEKYQWEFGDASPLETSNGSIHHAFPGTVDTVTVVVTVIDKTGGMTRDTGIVTITNNKPVAHAGNDTLIGLHKPLLLHGTGTDDGKIVKYEWNIASWNAHTPGGFVKTGMGDTTIFSPAENLPDTIIAILRITDDDGNTGLDTVKVAANMIWKCATPNAPWSARAGHATVALNDRMYLLGTTSDVWCSPNGAAWQRVSTAAAFQNGDGLVADTFSGKIFIAAGWWQPAYPYGLCQSIWSSVDGAIWNLVDSTPGYTPRIRPVLMGFNGYLWNIGGGLSFGSADCYYGTCKGVWRSQTGNGWSNVSDQPGYRSGHAGTLFRDSMWIVSGSGGYDGPKSDVIVSADGITWFTKTNATPFGSLTGHKCVSYGNSLWVLTGSAIWHSGDGITWTQATRAAPFAPRTGFSALLFQNRMWVMGGNDGSKDLNDVWYTDDLP